MLWVKNSLVHLTFMCVNLVFRFLLASSELTTGNSMAESCFSTDVDRLEYQFLHVRLKIGCFANSICIWIEVLQLFLKLISLHVSSTNVTAVTKCPV
jgi:hypothetical protein